MAASTFMPDVTVEIAFDSGYTTPAASRTWTDVSTYVEAQSLVNITRGRTDELDDVAPSVMTVTLDNKDGRFTPEYTAGANYPNVKKGRPIRVSAVWVLGGGGTTYRRFTGYVDEWAVEWPDKTSAMSTVTITATSRMARLGRSATLRSIIEEEILSDSPTLYYPLGDPEGSTSAASASGTAQDPLLVGVDGTGGTLVFGSGTGPGTDSLTAPTWTSAGSALNGKWLGKTLAATLVADHVALECWLSNTDVDGTSALISFGDGVTYMNMRLNGGSQLAMGTTVTGSFVEAVNSTTVTSDGLVHHAVLKLDVNGANYDATLMLDGAVVDTGASAISAANLATVIGSGKLIRVGANATGIPSTSNYMDGVISHVAVYSGATEVTTARFTEHYLAGSTGFETESSDEWIARIAGYADIPTAEQDLEAGNSTSIAFSDVTGKAPVEVMLDVTHTENGLLFDAGDGTLTFQSRGHRYGAASVLTLNASTQQLEGDLQPKLDDQGLVNDITATNPGGVSVRVVNDTSVADHGFYRETADVLLTNPLEIADYANLLATVYAEPHIRIPNVSIQVIVQPSATVTSLLAMELGDLVTLSNLPVQAPASTMTFFVEGIQESLGFAPSEHWLMTLNLSPGDIPGDVWILGTSQLGVDTTLAY